MKLYTENNNYIKLIPKKYKDFKNIIDFLEDETKKRLTEKERINIELQLFKDEIKKEKFVYELIESKRLIRVEKNYVRNNDPYYTAVFENNIKVKCSSNLFNVCENQTELFLTL